MRPRLASWPLWRLPTQSSRCGSSGPGRRGAACSSGRRGTARPRVSLRHRVALWTLPRLLIFPEHDKSPARAGLFLFPLETFPGGDLPVVTTTTPVAATPATAATPAPIPATVAAAAPAPASSAPAAMTAAAAAPAHFFGREAIDLLARRDGGLRIRTSGQFGVVGKRRRHQRGGLRARRERDAARGKSKGEFQKMAAFHHISSSIC
jgi:hypothetical protein